MIRRASRRLGAPACLAVAVLLPFQFNARLAGNVTDAEGNPIEGATVTITRIRQDPTAPVDPVEVLTDEEGNYYARQVWIDEVRITIQKEGFAVWTDERELRTGPNRLDVELTVPEPSEAMIRVEAANEALTAGQQAFVEERYDEAIASLEEALGNIDNPEENQEVVAGIWRIIGQSHAAQEQWQEAIAAYESWAQAAPDSPEPHLAMAEAYRGMGDEAAAATASERGLALEPEDPETLYNVGATLINENQTERGIESILRAVELRPEFPLAHKALGYAYARTEQYAKAVEHFELFLEQAPEDPEAAQVRDFVVALKEMIG